MRQPLRPLSAFLHEVEEVLRDAGGEAAPARLAGPMASLLADATWLPVEYRAPSADRYTQHLLHNDPQLDYSLVALVWAPGQATPIHDHRCWCVVGVYEGEERETSFGWVDDGASAGHPRLTPTAVRTYARGEVAVVVPNQPGDIHRVESALARGVSISLHLYGADVTRTPRRSSIFRVYDPVTGGVVEY